MLHSHVYCTDIEKLANADDYSQPTEVESATITAEPLQELLLKNSRPSGKVAATANNTSDAENRLKQTFNLYFDQG